MIKFSDLKKLLDSGQKQNFYIFTGDEREVMRQYIKRVDPNAQTVKSFSELWKQLTSGGLFHTDKTLVLYNDKEITERDWGKGAFQLVKAIGSNTVILVCDKIDGRVGFFKQATNFIVDFNKFTEEQLIGYIQGRLDVDDDTAILLARSCDNEIARIDNEIHKLSHVDGAISYELVSELVTPPAEDRIFDMIDFVVKRQPKQAFELYQDLIELKESPIKIISLLYTKFKHLIQVQSMFNLSNVDLAAKTGLTFYQIQRTRELVGEFTIDELVNFLRATQQMETDMKTGMVDINAGMEHLLVEILR